MHRGSSSTLALRAVRRAATSALRNSSSMAATTAGSDVAAAAPRDQAAPLSSSTRPPLSSSTRPPLSSTLKSSTSADPRTQGLHAGSNINAHQVSKTTDGFSVQTWAGGDGCFWWGLSSTQGRRPNMEDAHVVDLRIDDAGTALFGVFDGHAGKEVAAYCARNVRDVLIRQPAFRAGQLSDSLGEAFLGLESAMQDPAARLELFCLREGISLSALGEHPSVVAAAGEYGVQDEGKAGAYRGPLAGSTACVALVRGNQLCVASVGDSRCVLSDSGRAIALTRDHKPKDGEEARRIVSAGLTISNNRVCTKSSSLAMSRALGDTKYKQAELAPDDQAVTPVPDTTCAEVDTLAGAAAGTPETAQLGMADFMVLACDGLWDCMSNQQAITFAQVGMSKGLAPQQAAQALVEEALSAHSVTPASRDNITVLIVQFAPCPSTAT